MGDEVHVLIEFSEGFSGSGITDSGYQIRIGADGAVPYDLLLMGLGSCLYATFLEILGKKKISFTSTKIEVSGEKRREIPTTLESCFITVIIVGTDKSHWKSVEKSFELATKYCSIYKTISGVAEINWEVSFVDLSFVRKAGCYEENG